MTDLGSAWDVWRFNQNHKGPGPGGGQFAASQGSHGGKTTAGPRGGAKTRPSGARKTDHESAAEMAQKRHLIAQANSDRAQARALEQQLHALLQQQKAYSSSAAKAKAAAKYAAMTPRQQAAAKAKAAAAKKYAQTHHTPSTRQKISSLQSQIRGLLAHARELDAQAARI